MFKTCLLFYFVGIYTGYLLKEDYTFRVGNYVESIQINNNVKGKVCGVRINRPVESHTYDYAKHLYPDFKYFVEVEFEQEVPIYGEEEFEYIDEHSLLGKGHLINYVTRFKWLPDKDLRRIGK